MRLHGNLRKMAATLADPVAYRMVVVEEGERREADLTPLVGERLTLRFEGAIHCIACGRKTRKSFQQGYCFPCVRKLAECDSCIVKPEQCHFDEGTCRDEAWARGHCFQPHYVYLANSSGVKVGITRESQIPTRWIDQGATQALPIARVANRFQSGLLEVALKQHVSDRTDWRRMLKGAAEPVDLAARRDELFEKCGADIEALKARFGADIALLEAEPVVEITFPVRSHPARVVSHNFDKQPCVEGRLEGIKGQYLIFDSGVINLRKFGGYLVTVSAA